jgi:predicted outer membrane repeat protein
MLPIVFAATLKVPSSFTSVVDALGTANNGDTIEVDGTNGASYCVDTISEQITIVGINGARLAGDCDSDGNVANLTGLGPVIFRDILIDGEGTHRGIWVNADTDLTLSNVVIINGKPFTSNGDGGAIRTNGPLTIDDSIFCGNGSKSVSDGGAISADDDLTIRSSIFVRNVGAQDAGAVHARNGSILLEQNTFLGNAASRDGAAILISDGLAELTNNLFIGSEGPATLHVKTNVDDVTGATNLFEEVNAVDFDDTNDDNLVGSVFGTAEVTSIGTTCDDYDVSLWPGSLAIDAGTPAGTDIGAVPYTWPDNDSDGSKGDIDCDDTNSAIYPNADEICDGIDNDCDLLIDDDDDDVEFPTRFEDADGDTFGGTELFTCAPPKSAVPLGGDCNDSNPAVNPDVDEVCDDGIDNDCDPGTRDNCGTTGTPTTTEPTNTTDTTNTTGSTPTGADAVLGRALQGCSCSAGPAPNTSFSALARFVLTRRAGHHSQLPSH